MLQTVSIRHQMMAAPLSAQIRPVSLCSKRCADSLAHLQTCLNFRLSDYRWLLSAFAWIYLHENLHYVPARYFVCNAEVAVILSAKPYSARKYFGSWLTANLGGLGWVGFRWDMGDKRGAAHRTYAEMPHYFVHFPPKPASPPGASHIWVIYSLSFDHIWSCSILNLVKLQRTS